MQTYKSKGACPSILFGKPFPDSERESELRWLSGSILKALGRQGKVPILNPTQPNMV